MNPLSKTATAGYLLLLALSGVAFWPRYLSQLRGDVDLYTHCHAVLAVLWCLLLVAQPVLARTNRPIHRRLGAVSYVLAPAFAAASLLLAHARFRGMDPATLRAEAPSLFLPLSAVVLFSASFVMAIYWRRQVPLHARFMILTGLPMIDPVLGRILFFYGPRLPHALLYQAITFGITDLIVVLLLFRFSLPARLRSSYAVAAASFPVMHGAWFTVAQTQLWFPVAAWFRGLPLP